jgi:hypothetical protein
VRSHWTKNKGDIGVFRAQVDLAERGLGVLLPLTEHEAFDLVAYAGDRFFRVQVRYRAAVEGKLDIRFRSSWTDRHGTHVKQMNKSSIDVLCVYCPDTEKCYYVDPKKFRSGVSLRISPTRNNQRSGVLWADDFTEFPSASSLKRGRAKR